MLAARTAGDGWTQWHPGSRVILPDGRRGMTPPPDAEDRLSDDDLAAHGLWRVAVEAVPEGQVASGWTLIDVAGAPVLRPTLVDRPPDPVPRRVTNFQMRAALRGAGLFDQVQLFVEDLADPVALDAWEYANEVHRGGALVAAARAALGLSEEQLDALFVQAAAIEA